jgi:hypothetical protein
MKRTLSDPFEVVRTVGLSLPNVEVTRKYDGSPILKAGGAFIAGLASHPSAEANSLVVRSVPAIVTGSSRMRQRRTT